MVTTPVQVQTTAGIVEGRTRNGVHRFRGIPYAEPPVGALRLRAPRPAAAWSGVRPCYRWGSAPHQPKQYIPNRRRSEDCLTLNVVTTGGFDERLPVMFFIYGGGYFLGATSSPPYEGTSLARRGCVYVSANYRVGPLGALDLSSLSRPGEVIENNLFLRDLVLALQWVRDNIANFGGDPDNVTIAGVSAGGNCVETLMATPAAAGLFHRAIVQSTGNGMGTAAADVEPVAEKFAQLLGAGPDDAARIVLEASPKVLGRALTKLLADGVFPLGPSVDGDYLPHYPLAAMESGVAQRVPMIIGHNRDEAKLFRMLIKVVPLSKAELDALMLAADPDQRERILAAYPDYPARATRAQLAGDMVFSAAAWRIASAHQNFAPVYFYRYDYAPWTLRAAGLGPTHGTELMATFGSYRQLTGVALAGSVARRAALRVTDDIQQRWVEFTRTGVPGDGWPAYRVPERATMIFDSTPEVRPDPDGARRQAWDGVDFTIR